MITTVSRTLAQQIVNTVHDICGHDINFINRKGIIFASTGSGRIGTFHEIGKEAADMQKTIEVTENDNHIEDTSIAQSFIETKISRLFERLGIILSV